MQPSLPDILDKLVGWTGVSQQGKAPKVSGGRLEFMLAAPDEKKQQKIPLYSSKYFQACTVGGILACGDLTLDICWTRFVVTEATFR